MARTKGALNKRTRAALHAAQTGELGGGGISPIDYLLKVMRDSDKPDQLRIEAAKAVAPYLQPKLSSMDMSISEPATEVSEAELLERIKGHVGNDPKLKAALEGIFTAHSGESIATSVPSGK